MSRVIESQGCSKIITDCMGLRSTILNFCGPNEMRWVAISYGVIIEECLVSVLFFFCFVTNKKNNQIWKWSFLYYYYYYVLNWIHTRQDRDQSLYYLFCFFSSFYKLIFLCVCFYFNFCMVDIPFYCFIILCTI